jgi:hypothetical protein
MVGLRKLNRRREGERQTRAMFFSEEKNQKTFASSPAPSYQAMAGSHSPPRQQKLEVFASEKNIVVKK